MCEGYCTPVELPVRLPVFAQERRNRTGDILVELLGWEDSTIMTHVLHLSTDVIFCYYILAEKHKALLHEAYLLM